VAYHESRVEYMLTGSHPHTAQATITLGAKTAGTRVAMDCTFYGDAAGNGATWAGGLSWPIRTTFTCPNARFVHVDIATNTPRTAAWRCVADPPGDVVMNVLLDQMAYKLGMDPVAFRVKNCIDPLDVHQDTKLPFAGVAPAECFQKAADGIGWSSKFHAPGARTLSDGRLHGIGIAGHIDSHGQMSSPAGAIVNLNKDGTALCTHGQSHCAGTVNSSEHIVAETLGMNYEDIEVGEVGNTDVGSECGSEGGSKQTITLGSAFQRAAEDARDQAFDVAATQLKITKDKVAAKNGVVYEVGNESNSITWKALAAKFPHPIVGRGWSWSKTLQRPLGSYKVGDSCETRGGAAQAIEIAVDTETGLIEVLNQVNVVDTGRSIYLNACNKEIIGGMEIMQGEALFYEQVIEKSTGATLNVGHIDHKYPTSLDIHPDAMTPLIVESDDKCGPYGAHGIGEPCVTSTGAFISALYNATGKWVMEYPLAPWKVLKALGKA
jgi:CO/xanthine dehydrogenase Mo-binding subunit